MASDLPEGFIYRPDVLTSTEEQTILEQLPKVDFGEVKMRGVVARRRVAHFGWLYGYESWKIEPGPQMPDFLLSLREQLAAAIPVEPDRLVEALVTEYPPGAGIGWHRDAPPFGIVVAVSLLSSCRFRFRHGANGDRPISVVIEPRSVYAISGAARSSWQHSIPPMKALRYSVTFRTLRSKKIT